MFFEVDSLLVARQVQVSGIGNFACRLLEAVTKVGSRQTVAATAAALWLRQSAASRDLQYNII